MKFLALIFTVAVSFLQTTTVMAAEGLVTCTGGDECNFCSFINMVNGLIEWLIIVAVALTVLLLAFAGFRLVTSGGDAAGLEQAKKIFVSSIIGIMIMLAGWTIVDTVLKVTAGGDLGVWNAVECGGAYDVADAQDIVIELEQYDGIEIESSSPLDNPYGPGGVYAEEGPGSVATIPPAATADGGFTYNSGISAQRVHASPALSSIMNCMAQIVPGNVGRVSSISDSLIVNGSQTFQSCAGGGCAHTANSRHYGGATCTGSSYAADFGDEENVEALCNAAYQCGGSGVYSCSVHNGNHVHLSLKLSC
jgi:hypothetical protein